MSGPVTGEGPGDVSIRSLAVTLVLCAAIVLVLLFIGMMTGLITIWP